jgi:hypothetical protein
MLDDVAGFLILAPLTATLIAVLAVSAWLLRDRQVGPRAGLEDQSGQ